MSDEGGVTLSQETDHVSPAEVTPELGEEAQDTFNDVMHLLKIMLKANGRSGVPQGGVISPLLSNVYLNEVDRMLERAKEATRNGHGKRKRRNSQAFP